MSADKYLRQTHFRNSLHHHPESHFLGQKSFETFRPSRKSAVPHEIGLVSLSLIPCGRLLLASVYYSSQFHLDRSFQIQSVGPSRQLSSFHLKARFPKVNNDCVWRKIALTCVMIEHVTLLRQFDSVNRSEFSV
ncbi:unnamed protein product [Calypogeia fissa]